MERVTMESLDSLWFYGNVFTTSVLDSSLTKHVQTEVVSHVTEDVLKPVLPVVEDQKNEPESEAGSSIPVTPRYDEVIAMATEESEVAEAMEYYCPSPREKEQRRRRPRSKRGLQRNRRRILGELDLGFHGKAEGFGSDWFFLEENFGYKINHQFNLNDNMAMKEHLKTWAYAVACTVR